MNKKSKLVDIIVLCLILFVYGAFNIFLADKFFPITEGWFSEASMYLKDGKVLYKDFAMYIPPVYPLLIAFLTNVLKLGFLGLRIYGIIERLVLIALVYYILRKMFPIGAVVIAILTSSIFYIANLQDLFYGYYQTSFMLAVLSLAIFIFADSKFFGLKNGLYIFNGFIVALLTYTKHTLGIVIFVFYFVYFIIKSITKKDKIEFALFINFVLSYVFFMLVGIIIAITTGALIPMYEQLFASADSKGSIFTVLFGFLENIKTFKELIIPVLLLFGVLFASKYINFKNKIANIIKNIVCILLIALFIVLLTNSYSLKLKPTDYVFFVLALVTALIACLPFYGKFKSLIKCTVFIVGGIYLFTKLLKSDMPTFYNTLINGFFSISLSYSCFIIIFIVALISLVRTFIKTETFSLQTLLISGFAFFILYIHGMSGTLEPHGTQISLSFIICSLLTNNKNSRLNKQDQNNSYWKEVALSLKEIYVKFVVVGFCLILLIGCFAQRIFLPYHWWGVGACPKITESTYTFKDPNLKGIKSTKEIVNEYNEIYDLINGLKKQGDKMYTFPHVNYFNVMANLPSPTFAKVHFFDVCPDKFALSDLEVIQREKPEFIIYCDLSEDAYAVHEELFRGGELSGQRELIAGIKTLCNAEYDLIYTTSVISENTIYIYYKR